MKITLKNIKVSVAQTIESTAYTADIYINDKKIGKASNSGRGGSASYQANNRELLKVLLEAERFCISFPLKGGLKSSLATVFDDLVEEYLVNKENKKMQKLTETAILFGVPGGNCSYVKYKRTISEILASANGHETIKLAIVNSVIPFLREGDIIINTNIPLIIYKQAGLKKNQYKKSA